MKIVNLVVAIWKLVAKYPAVTAGVFQVVILAGTQIGLHLTTAQLTTLAGTVAAIFAVLVHAGVIPVTKVANVKAGVTPTVPKGVSVVDSKPPVPEGFIPTEPSPVVVSPSVSAPSKEGK